jgi:hypothetical protein
MHPIAVFLKALVCRMQGLHSMDFWNSIPKGIPLKQRILRIADQDGARALCASLQGIPQKWVPAPKHLNIRIGMNASISLFLFWFFLIVYCIVLHNGLVTLGKVELQYGGIHSAQIVFDTYFHVRFGGQNARRLIG